MNTKMPATLKWEIGAVRVAAHEVTRNALYDKAIGLVR